MTDWAASGDDVMRKGAKIFGVWQTGEYQKTFIEITQIQRFSGCVFAKVKMTKIINNQLHFALFIISATFANYTQKAR